MTLAPGVRIDGRTADTSTGHDLPRPPSDEEKYSYLGPQHRWLLLLQGLSFTLIAYSVFRFAVSDAHLLIFLAPMSLFAITMVVSALSSTRRRRISLPDHLAQVRDWAGRSDWPSVDVFLPTAGEPLDVLANTYHHVALMDWPGRLSVLVLDDADRSEVRELAETYGFAYRVRPDRGRLKKAGNLRYGYGISDGDLIAIFDADFVPRTDYLHELVPYFEDTSVGIVQSPQYFDAVAGMSWIQRCAGATQELFYRWIQPSRDRSGAAICVGTCAVYRRAALERSGGFAQIGHSEDVHTGVNLLRVGYVVRYVPVVLSKGLCPDTLQAFVNQQYRWCTGSMSLLADNTFHDEPTLTVRRRLCFWAGFLYYISTAVNVLVAPLVALAMIWYLPGYVEPANSVWLIGALALWLVVLPLVMRGRWRIDVLRVQLLYSYAHAVAITHIVTGRTREWVATGAADRKRTSVAVTILRVAKTYTGVALLALVVGLAVRVQEYGLGEYWAMVCLAGLALYVQLPLLLTPATRREP